MCVLRAFAPVAPASGGPGVRSSCFRPGSRACAVLGGPSALRRCLRALSPAPGVRGVRGARAFCIARADA
eukprot:12787232-Heterocapsa_arctica.AAC.1